jgi:hypothetical protein
MNPTLIEKLSSLVVDQLPEFLRVNTSDPTSDSPYRTFVSFLQAYYEFLEQDGEAQYVLQNSRSYKDIDDTIDDFVDKFLQEFAYDLPKTIFSDQNPEDSRVAFSGIDQLESKRAIAKRIGSLYASKGSEAAIRLLFRLLFDDEIIFYYPKDDMLRSSDGRWYERTTAKIYDISGGSDSLNYGGNTLTGATSASSGVIDRVGILGTEGNLSIYEVEFDVESLPTDFIINETVDFLQANSDTGNIDIIDSGKITGVITDVIINDVGYGYAVDDSIILVGDGGDYSARIAAVNGGGAILRIGVDNFGANYTAVTSITTSTPTQSKTGQYEFTGNLTTGNGIVTVYTSTDHGLNTNDIANITIAANSRIQTLTKKLSSKKFTYAVVGNTFLSSSGNLVINPRMANLTANIGTICRYFGTKSGKEGETNEQIKIQDSYYYQDYSYVIRTTQQSVYWRDLVKKILHPAGMELFGEVYVSSTEGGDTAVAVSSPHDVYSVIVILLKVLEIAVSDRVSVSTALEIVLSLRASRDLEKYTVGPSYKTLENFKFDYTDMHIYDVADLTLDLIGSRINDFSLFPPPNIVKKTGSNIVLNSTFSVDNNWTKGSGWTIANGNAIGTATSANLNQLTTVAAVNETTYFCQYEIKQVSAGSIRVTLAANGYSNTSPTRSTAGTYRDYFLLVSSNVLANANLIVTGTTFSGNIGNIILRPLETVIG